MARPPTAAGMTGAECPATETMPPSLSGGCKRDCLCRGRRPSSAVTRNAGRAAGALSQVSCWIRLYPVF